MKKYALYPGEGRVSPSDPKTKYVDGRQLASCYRVPYSECLDCSLPPIKKVMGTMTGKSAPIYLLHLLPRQDGKYRLPSKEESKLILVTGLHEQINTDG